LKKVVALGEYYARERKQWSGSDLQAQDPIPVRSTEMTFEAWHCSEKCFNDLVMDERAIGSMLQSSLAVSSN